jgi:hypothetical protein
MAMIVTCPCGRQLRLDEQFAGRTVRCPICRQTFVASADKVGDFQIENPLPPSEPAPPPRLRETPATRPSQDSESSTYDLAPASASKPASPASRPRPAIRAIEDDDEEPEESERIRRKVRRPSGSRGQLRPGSWPNVKAFDLTAGVLLIGALVAFFLSILNLSLASASSATPQRITLAQLLANGPGNNAHVLVTDFVPAQNYVYLYQQVRGKYNLATPPGSENRNWTEVWVPLVPLTAEMKDRLAAGGDIADLLHPRAVRVVVRLANVHDRDSVEQWCGNKREVKGLVVNSVSSLNTTTKDLLKQSYPDSDFSTCLLIHEGRKPPWAIGIIFGFGMGTLLMVAGSLWFIFRLVFRER